MQLEVTLVFLSCPTGWSCSIGCGGRQLQIAGAGACSTDGTQHKRTGVKRTEWEIALRNGDGWVLSGDWVNWLLRGWSSPSAHLFCVCDVSPNSASQTFSLFMPHEESVSRLRMEHIPSETGEIQAGTFPLCYPVIWSSHPFQKRGSHETCCEYQGSWHCQTLHQQQVIFLTTSLGFAEDSQKYLEVKGRWKTFTSDNKTPSYYQSFVQLKIGSQ